MAGSFSEQICRMQDLMNKVMESAGISGWGPGYLERDVAVPLADIKETDDAVIVIMDLPGINKEDVEISAMDDALRVIAKRTAEKEESEKGYHRRERAYSRFERVVSLPVAVKADEAKAKLENGVLEITLPKEVVTSRKTINIT